MFRTLASFKMLLFECRSVLSPTQRSSGSEFIIFIIIVGIIIIIIILIIIIIIIIIIINLFKVD